MRLWGEMGHEEEGAGGVQLLTPVLGEGINGGGVKMG